MIFLALLLAGCAAGPSGLPEAVLVQRDRITVAMSSGWPCTGFRPDNSRTGESWAGTLQGCPESYGYRVTLAPGVKPVRLVLQPVPAGIALATLPKVLVEIITPQQAIYRFRENDAG